MNKRLQVVVSKEAWDAVDALCKEANQGFDAGNITFSDAVNELILSAKPDVKALQTRRTDLRRALRSMAGREDLDLDSAIRFLSDLKGKSGKKRSNTPIDEEF